MINNKKDLYTDILSQITPDSIRSSIDMLRVFAAKGSTAAIDAHIDELDQRYFYMLRFIAAGNSVPGIAMELKAMAETARNICAELQRVHLADEASTLYSAQLRYQNLRPEENLQSLVSDYLAELERLRTDSASLTDSRRAAVLERIASDIFMRLWVEMPLSPDVVELMLGIFEDSEIPQHDRELWLGAVGLGLLSYDDKDRRHLLLRVHGGFSEDLSPIAAVWLVFAVTLHDKFSLDTNPVYAQMMAACPEDLADVYFELFRACGTKELSETMDRDFMPGMIDIGRRMADRFGSDPEKVQEALRNGEWDGDIDAEGFDKIKGFIDAQNRGDDVYMSTLGKMRQFPFFNNIPAWFLPFYTGHSALADVTDGEVLAFADTVGRMPFLCDSDKYALLLSVASAPAQMRDTMLRGIVEQQSALGGDMLDAALEEMKSQGRKAVISRYVKNLYRFFTLFRRKDEFPPLFDVPVLYRSFPADLLLDAQSDKLSLIAELLLRLRHYHQAATTFHFLVIENPENLQAYQKMGFAHELDGDMELAECSYVNALGLKQGDIWTVRRLANVLDMQCKHKDVVELLEPLSRSISDDEELLGLFAKAACNTGDVARALELYYNMAYLSGGDSVKPDIAWMQVLNNELDAAESTFADFIGTSSRPEDFLHYGHLLWARNDVPAAIDEYAKAAAMVSPGKTSFSELFEASITPALEKILSSERRATLRIVPDIIAFRTYGSRFGKI